MGYTLEAIIGTESTLLARSSDFPSITVVPLGLGLALIPITDELLDEIGAAGDSGRFCKFTPSLENWLRTISVAGPVAYVEAEYFGGVGEQGSTVWAHNEQLLGPTHQAEAINMALRILGVSPGTSHDEFAAVGLHRHRDTGAWLADANPDASTA